MLLAALAAALLVVVLGFLLLKGNGDDKGNQASKTSTPTATAKKKETPSPTPTATKTETPAPTPKATKTPKPEARAAGRAAGGSASQLQVEAYNLNNAGKYDAALPVAQQAVLKGCQGDAKVSPCGYALYELGRAQLGTGDAAGAVATLNQRLQRYPDDQRPTVRSC